MSISLYNMRQFGRPDAAAFLQAWLLVVTLEHGGGDFDTVRPMAAPLPGVGLIILQAVGVGLNHPAGFEEQQSRFVSGHPHNKGFGVVKGAPEPRGDDLRIRRLGGSQRTPFLRRVMSASADFGN